MNLDPIQQAAAEQFGKQSSRYGQGHILADISDVQAALAMTNLPIPAEVLDVATGAGHTGLYLAGLGHRVTLADVAEPMLFEARQAALARGLQVRTERHAAERFPYANRSIDLVTCRVAAHHFSSPRDFISETARVLSPGGWLILIDGSVEDGHLAAEEWIHQVEKWRDPSHHRFLSPNRWKELCAAHDLKIISCALQPFKQPDLQWYFETAATSPENRTKVLDLVRNAPLDARALFNLTEEHGKIIWWWRRLTLVARKF